jgi:Glyoxalase-like domain
VPPPWPGTSAEASHTRATPHPPVPLSVPCGMFDAPVRGGDPLNAERGFPRLLQVVLDCTDARVLAEFYRRLLGWRYRPGDEPPPAGEPDPRGQDWLVLQDPGGARLAFQQVAVLPEATWPEGPVPQQLHLDLTVPTTAELEVQHRRALELGARLLQDRSDDPEEPLRVYADPAGHPFCIFVA